ncbi:unnamed protein product, partial [Thlaspi arvense]
VKKKLATDVYIDDDGWGSAAISCVRIVICFVSMMITTFIWALVMLVLLPWPCERIRQGKIYGHVTEQMLPLAWSERLLMRTTNSEPVTTDSSWLGKCHMTHFWMYLGVPSTGMWILGNPIKVEGEIAIYISNHASPIGIFLIMWLTPTGTVGIVKKEEPGPKMDGYFH